MKTFANLMERIQRLQDARERTAHIPLKACPFCGSVAFLYSVMGVWCVECVRYVECGANGPTRETAAEAARAWNERRME